MIVFRLPELLTMNQAPSASTDTELLSTISLQAKLATRIMHALPTLLVLSIIGVGWTVMHHINAQSLASLGATEIEDSVANDTLRLPQEKLKSASFESVPSQPVEIQHLHSVPGRVRYDSTKRVNMKASLDGIVTELQVAPGDKVSCGDLVAVVRSPEIGRARAVIAKIRKELGLAQQVLEREQILAKNLSSLSVMLDQRQTSKQIESSISDLDLGTYRQEILSAYSKVRLAEELIAKVQPLVEEGAVAGRIVRQRETERQLAETSFRTARDQADFDTQQKNLKSEADVLEAERQLDIAHQSLESLLGYKEDEISFWSSNQDDLSRLEIRAPLDATVESRSFANNERVMRGDSIVVLANTDTLLVEASIRESDWPAVGIDPSTEVAVIVPALDDREFKAKVRYIGREMQADTNAIPLIAQIDNHEGLLRPGMFVRVAVPIGEVRQALSVKPESILQHENQEFVFVEMTGGDFKKVNVSTGQSSEQWVEVTEGLSPGQLVVTQGAFLLKSEFLLQGEGE
jgi:membrane fusion protein, heavy metal efflux system